MLGKSNSEQKQTTTLTSNLPLHQAIIKDDVAEVKRLLSSSSESSDLVNQFDENNHLPLHCAIFCDRIDIIKLLLEHSADVDLSKSVPPLHTPSPLCVAVYMGKLAMVELLMPHHKNGIDAKHDKFAVSSHMQSVATKQPTDQPLVLQGAFLHIAACNEQTDIIVHLLVQGADVKSQDEQGRTVLHIAGGNFDKTTVKYLLSMLDRAVFSMDAASSKSEADPKTGIGYWVKLSEEMNAIRDDGGLIPLIFCLKNYRVVKKSDDDKKEVIIHLLKKCLSSEIMELKDQLNRYIIELEIPPSISAVFTARFQMEDRIKILAAREKNSTPRAWISSSNPGLTNQRSSSPSTSSTSSLPNSKSASAVQEDKDNVLDYLLQVSDLPLQQAILSDKPEEVSRLLSKSTKNQIDKLGRTPLHCAILTQNTAMVELLLNHLHRPSIERVEKTIASPLMLAAYIGNIEIVKLLLKDKKVNLNAKEIYFLLYKDLVASYESPPEEFAAFDYYAWAPLHAAASRGHLSIVSYLCENGATINTTTSFSRTALHLAATNFHTDVVGYFLGLARMDRHALNIDRETALLACLIAYDKVKEKLDAVKTATVKCLLKGGCRVSTKIGSGLSIYEKAMDLILPKDVKGFLKEQNVLEKRQSKQKKAPKENKGNTTLSSQTDVNQQEEDESKSSISLASTSPHSAKSSSGSSKSPSVSSTTSLTPSLPPKSASTSAVTTTTQPSDCEQDDDNEEFETVKSKKTVKFEKGASVKPAAAKPAAPRLYFKDKPKKPAAKKSVDNNSRPYSKDNSNKSAIREKDKPKTPAAKPAAKKSVDNNPPSFSEHEPNEFAEGEVAGGQYVEWTMKDVSNKGANPANLAQAALGQPASYKAVLVHPKPPIHLVASAVAESKRSDAAQQITDERLQAKITAMQKNLTGKKYQEFTNILIETITECSGALATDEGEQTHKSGMEKILREALILAGNFFERLGELKQMSVLKDINFDISPASSEIRKNFPNFLFQCLADKDQIAAKSRKDLLKLCQQLIPSLVIHEQEGEPGENYSRAEGQPPPASWPHP